MVARGKENMAFLTRQLIIEAGHGSRPIGSPASLGEIICTPVVPEGGQQLDAGDEFLQHHLPLLHRLVQSSRFQTETSQHGMLFTTFVGEAADQR